MSTNPGQSALEAGNEIFHGAYGGARDGVRDHGPILVVMPSELALHHQRQRQGVPYSRASFARAKSAAHIAVALFSLTCAESDPEQSRVGLTRLLGHIAAALEVAQRADAAVLDQEIQALLERCLHFAQATQGQARSEPLRSEFASDAGSRILRITELATCEQVAALHEAVETILGQLSARDQEELQVVVIGDHQARVRSLGMQYFKRRFREAPGTDQRVTYGENIEDEAEAISLVATRRLDQRIARAFFGDENRLQRDVLGDAAKRCLDERYFAAE